MKISLDFDSVLSNTMISWVEKYNGQKGAKYTKANVTSWEFWEQTEFKMSHADANKIFEELWKDWKNLPTTEDNHSLTTSKLSELGIIDVVTDGSEDHLQFKKKWLDKHKINYRELVPAKKHKEEMDYDVFIDDSPSLAEALNKIDKTCILYHQEWNKHVDGERIYRINKLIEALQIIKSKKF